MNINGMEPAPEGISPAPPFTGTPLEALSGLAGGIVMNCTDLVNGLATPDADRRSLMEESGYALAADILTTYRLSRIPHIMAIFNKPPDERSWKDSRTVAKAWLSDRFDGDLADLAKEKSHYGGAADKLADKALWHGPAALQVMHGEMPPLVFTVILMRDRLLERKRVQATRDGNNSAHTAIAPGQYKTGLAAAVQVFSASPAGARYPQARENLQWATALASVGSGLLTAAEINKANSGSKYADRVRFLENGLGLTALK
jgi:phosphatidylglycerophosphate synthase